MTPCNFFFFFLNLAFSFRRIYFLCNSFQVRRISFITSADHSLPPFSDSCASGPTTTVTTYFQFYPSSVAILPKLSRYLQPSLHFLFQQFGGISMPILNKTGRHLSAAPTGAPSISIPMKTAPLNFVKSPSSSN